MNANVKRYGLAAVVSALVVCLSACIGSPLPPGSVASLHHWSDLESALATRVGEVSEERGGYYSGDFDFTDVLLEIPALAETPEAPLLLKSCNEQACYSLVVFGDLFTMDGDGKVKGYASMTALSTAMANEVAGLPAEEVRAALNELAARLSADGETDYAAFVGLDPERKTEDRELLLNARLYDTANELILADSGFTVSKLLGEATTNTEELYVPDDFDFDDSWDLAVDVDVSRELDEPAYLLICETFAQEGSGYDVQYGDCMLNTPLRQGRYTGAVKMTGGVAELLAVILPLDRPNDPTYARWSRSVDGEMFKVR